MPNQVTQPQTPSTASSLDPQIVNLAKALRQTESGGNFAAKGASGEYGAYQFLPSTWDATAPKYGVRAPLDQATPEQQNEVAYKQLADWKKEHPDWNVGNFASAWNAGPGKPSAYLENNVGTNSSGVKYDTPTYAKKVAQAYQQYKSQGSGFVDPSQQPQAAQSQFIQPPQQQTQAATNQPAQQPEGLLSQIGHGAMNILNTVEKPFIGAAAIPVQALAAITGQKDPYANYAQQTGGPDVTPLDLEKKAGDIAQVGSYFVPGSGVLSAAGMGVLQGAGSAMSEGQDLPTVATSGGVGGVLGAGAAGLTKLAGAGLQKLGGTLTGDAAVKATQGIKDAYSSALNLNASERGFEQRSGKDLAQVLLDNGVNLSKHENGTLDASEAITKLQAAMDPLNQQAKQVLSHPQGVVNNIHLPDVLNEVKDRIQALPISQLEKDSAIDHASKVIQAEAKQYGADVTPEVADRIKQGMWGSSFRGKLTSVDKLQGNVSYLTGNTLKTKIEEAVANSDAGNVLPEINKQRSDLADAIKRLTNLDGVRILKGGRLGNMAGGVVGAITGAASGLGAPGALAGDYFGTKAAEFLNNPATKIAIARAKAQAMGKASGVLGRFSKPVGQAALKSGTAIKSGARASGLLTNILTK